MSRRERLFRIIGLTPDDLVLEADRPVRRRGWRAPLAAACLAAVCVLGFGLFGGGHLGNGGGNLTAGGSLTGGSGGGSSAPGDPSIGGGGHDGGAEFMSYAGPVFPLDALEEGLTAERAIAWNLTMGTYADGSPRQWGVLVNDMYTLTNPTNANVTAQLLYPYAGSLMELDRELPHIYVNDAEISPRLLAGPYSGGFRSASEDGGDTLNLQELTGWTQYQALLEDGRYQAQALAEYAPLDIPVTVYRFSDFEAPTERYSAATQAVSFPIDDEATQILTYGFNGYERENESGFRQYSYFVPDGVTRNTELKLLVVLGEDLASYQLQGYLDGGCEPGEEIEGVKCTVTREASTLEAVLDEVCRDYREYYSQELPESFTPAMHLRAAAELLTQYGLLSGSTMDRYDTGMLEDIAGEAMFQQRVMYLAFTVEIPAGGSVRVEARLWKAPSHDFYCGQTENQGVQGYDLVTRLGSNLAFTRQTALLEHAEFVEIVRQNFGFDPGSGVTEVTLDLDEPHYYLEIRPAAGNQRES